MAEAKGWKDADTAIKSYTELEKRLTEVSSRAVAPPPEDAPREQWDAFYARIGRPQQADGYEFKLPDGLPETMPYDGESAARYKQWSHEAGLSPRQAQTLHDAFVRDQAQRYADHAATLVRRGERAHGELIRAWGDTKSAAYAQNVGFANRFIERNGGDALLRELKESGLLSTEGAVLSPGLAKAFARAGRTLYAEDQFATGNAASRAADPARTLYPNDPFASRR
ncbi:hypothetical protein [Labrys monachus]|uniref:Uncharacterized protein n=1 Tax=Labrys monachus TaxID=217067 RepID=A0ABU0FC40_9HYPH|nr:hypothetical protein [Labrys monachus]MDQ0392183.1 hypothetical protein [Labrys monachus]